MSDGKGKERATAIEESEEPDTFPNVPPSSSSLLDRVAASASGLARNVFAAPTSNELSEHAAAASASSGKGQRSVNGGSSSWAESSRTSQQNSSSPGLQQSARSGFRSSHQEQHVAAAEAEFASFLDGIDTFVPSVDQGGEPTQIDDYNGNLNWINKASDFSNKTIRTAPFQAVQQQEAEDGKDVLNILSDRSPTTADYYPPQNIEDEIEEWRLTDEQVAALREITKELFAPAEQHKPADISDPLNLQPAAFSSLDTSIWLPDEYAQASQSYLGQVVSPGEASRLWVEQWEGVLSRYQDEVWGGLLPLVKEAREEIEAIKQAPEDHRPKALKRLGLVLGHFKS